MKKRKVIKLGGSVWDSIAPEYFEEWRDWIEAGNELLIVHGGGPKLSAYCTSQQIEPLFLDGRRVTTDEVLIGAWRVLAGEMQTDIVSTLTQHDIDAFGLSGVDGNAIVGHRLTGLGKVGEVVAIRNDVFEQLMDSGHVPVVTSMIASADGPLNCNGDDCAVALAVSLQADEFELLTDVNGIRIHGEFQTTLHERDVQEAIANGEIYGGMVPKVEALLAAVAGGVKSARIRDGSDATLEGTRLWEGNYEFAFTDIRTTND
ncbi:acetylglutamate kinase [Exiguobacterium sp. MMG028]|uniref:acetylglutamate kinase n=1 Tax=Exiguobacterium sp. MMG028 TaxID=3021979 RepID=UPI0022FE7736|nr:acetylglutamate kinase [Exiguobacterium sp. MMG028]MDA5561492.1 acetylglutamate kinase [Exiguobacterium sp. MMG028]